MNKPLAPPHALKPEPDQEILIIDDDRATRMLLRGALQRQGYRVREAADGEQGLAAFAQERPALVLLDVMMPVLDGFATCARMHDRDPEGCTPIIMLTAADDLDAIDQAFTAGATDFIVKPINWSLLNQRLRYALRGAALNRELRQSQLRQNSARRLAKLLFWEWHLDDDSLHWNDDLRLLTGLSEAPLELNSVDQFLAAIHPEDRERALGMLKLVREQHARVDLELRLRLPGRNLLVRMVGERGGQTEDHDRVLGALQDLTDRRRTEALVDYLSLHDNLTELANRRLFLSQVQEALGARPAKSSDLIGVLWIDLVRFHRQNDVLGNSAGDMLLRLFAGRLSQLVPDSGAAARVGGDEFAALLHAQDRQEAINSAEVLLGNLSTAYGIDEREALLRCSAGLALAPEHGSDAQSLLTRAQEAQRTARAQKRQLALPSRDTAYTRGVNQTLDLERDLHLAIEREEFFLVYQPQMNLGSGQIVGCEALLRWQHPEQGLIPPLKFIPMLEDLGLIDRMGDWVLREALRQCASWQDTGLPLRVGINLSPRQFLDPELCNRLDHLLRDSGAPPGLVELEITESLTMQNPREAIEMMRRFRALGVKLALDDFGIGYSSLEYLLRFPIDTIKIDRAFVTNITRALEDRAIVRAVTALGQTLKHKIIAEGIETQRQCDFLEALGVDEIQGYLIGRPMSPDALSSLVEDFHRPGVEDETSATVSPSAGLSADSITDLDLEKELGLIPATATPAATQASDALASATPDSSPPTKPTHHD
ncbi:Cyclic di-GMP phosphodiesterase Gmr [Thiorhodovibrio winogradskyi]|uniref:Cyclic di-GMP phosphodiesterase Gmr n=1 Tax=Thiorhodovibrio winogradskyi TaxID=77007 RepID=A0ABZ0SB97_9GAMM|nr:EAL domain-containing protein [Thiorhodovibrio winogradskyi]